MNNVEKFPKVYGAYNIIDEERLKSSSGGIFYAIARYVIESNGVVFGATLDLNNNEVLCYHKKCNNMQTLDDLLGSKYIQSSLGNIFSEIKNLLEQNIAVLFCGSPCQVSGLSKYLGKEYEKLFLIDFICHGVPNKYLLEKVIMEEGNGWPKKIEFRNKKYGWRNYSMAFYYQDKQVIYRSQKESNFMKLYLTDAYLRPSCYKCKNRNKRFSDITIGDFWGSEHYFYGEENLQRGLSLIVVNTIKGEKILRKLETFIKLKEINMSYFKYSNLSYRLDSVKPFDIKKMNKLLYSISSKNIIKYYEKTNFLRRLIEKIKRRSLSLLKKIKKYLKYLKNKFI